MERDMRNWSLWQHDAGSMTRSRPSIWLRAVAITLMTFALVSVLHAETGSYVSAITFIGERGDLYVIKVDYRTLDDYGDVASSSLSYVVRRKADNTEVARYPIPDSGSSAANSDSNPVDESEWTPVTPYTDDLVRFSFLHDILDTGRL